MADIPELQSSSAPVLFNPERADLSVTVTFSGHLWPLFHNVLDLYSALLNELADFGITVSGIKSDVGDGSLGAYNVNFWLLGFR